MSDRKLRVFLCHSSQDKPIVRELYQRLNAEGWIDPWLDEEKLLPGQDWDMEIEKAVESADAVIVCLSNNSVTKEGYLQKELRKILDVSDEKPEGTIFVIPIRMDNVKIPRRLSVWQYVDFFPSTQKGLSYIRLMASLRQRAKDLHIIEQKTESTEQKTTGKVRSRITWSLAWPLGIELFLFFLTFLFYDIFHVSPNLSAVPIGMGVFLWFYYGLGGIGGWLIFFAIGQLSILVLVFYSLKNRLPALQWQIGIVLAASLILPSFLYRITTGDELSPLYPFSESIFYVGILGGILPVAILIGYLINFHGLIGCPNGHIYEKTIVTCPQCGYTEAITV